jgi:hypothetical protein
MYIPDSIVPGGGLEFSHPTENKQVIENYASNKRPKLPIRGYLVRIRYTPFCPQFDSDYGYIYTAHRAHSLLPRLFSQIDAPLPGSRSRLAQGCSKAPTVGVPQSADKEMSENDA